MIQKNVPQLPRWQSHKVVEADKITATLISNEPGVTPWVWVLAGGERIEVSLPLKNRVPTGVEPLGGYYVRYADGFESWSPAHAFEEGYTLIVPISGPNCEARAELTAEAEVEKGKLPEGVTGVRNETYE